MNEKIDEIITKMEKDNNSTMDNLVHMLSGLRTNRPSTGLLEQIYVEAYGTTSKLEHLSTITIKDRTLIVQPWDKSVIKNIEKAIMTSNLSLHPIIDGDIVKVTLPELNQKMREDLVKKAHEYAEKAKISIRGARRDALEHIKKISKEYSEDLIETYKSKVQKIIDVNIEKINDMTAKRIQNIIEV